MVPTGLNKGVKKLVKGKVPNLSRYDDIAEYLENGGGGGASESEAEDDEASKVDCLNLKTAEKETIFTIVIISGDTPTSRFIQG